MAETSICKAGRKTLLVAASRVPGTYNSEDWFLVDGAGGVILMIEVTDVGSSGSIDTISFQAKDGINYDTVVTFATQAITATGRYRYRIVPGAAASGGAYKGVANDALPAQGRVQVIHTTGTMVYSIKMEATNV